MTGGSNLLQLLIRVVDAELLEAVHLKALEPEDILLPPASTKPA